MRRPESQLKNELSTWVGSSTWILPAHDLEDDYRSAQEYQARRFFESMTEIHSWCGLLSGWVLFAVCLTGALTVFDNEITDWMQPELLAVSDNTRGFNETVPLVVKSLVQVDRWDGSGLTDRASVLVVKLQEKRTFSSKTLNPPEDAEAPFRRNRMKMPLDYVVLTSCWSTTTPFPLVGSQS